MTKSSRSECPLIVSEQGDLTLHPTAAEAAAHVEAIDVRAGVFEAYDCRGTRMEFEIEGRDNVVIRPTAATDVARLEALLRDFVHRVGPGRYGTTPEWVDAASLAELVDALWTVEKQFRASGVLARLGRRWAAIVARVRS
jgi:hypothetical protein